MRRTMRSVLRRAQQQRSVFIQVEKTPNPLSLKFLPSRAVLGDDSSGFHFSTQDKDYLRSPLAKKLLTIDDVASVFLGKDFVTVSKKTEGAWPVIKPMVFSYMMDWYAEGTKAVEDVVESDTAVLEDDSEVVAMIKELIEVRIRPAVQEDGGDIFYRGFNADTGMVQVELAGSCVGCPSSSVTLRNGVENMLMHYVEEVKGIENVTPDDDEDAFKLSFPRIKGSDDPEVTVASSSSSPGDNSARPAGGGDDPRVSL